jgi:hypothetical protein
LFLRLIHDTHHRRQLPAAGASVVERSVWSVSWAAPNVGEFTRPYRARAHASNLLSPVAESPTIEEAVAICRELATARPDAFRPVLSGSLNNQANVLSALGRVTETGSVRAEADRIVVAGT